MRRDYAFHVHVPHSSRVPRSTQASSQAACVSYDGEMRAPIKCALAYATFPKESDLFRLSVRLLFIC